jgi:RNA recognition motif-containing protein
MQQSQDVNNSKVYIGNLPYSVTEEKLREICQEFGEIKYAKVIEDHRTHRSKGFAFVEFNSADAAQAAIKALHGTLLEDRELVVNIARPRAPRSNNRSYNNRGSYNDRGSYGNRDSYRE